MGSSVSVHGGNHFLEKVFSPGPPFTKTFNELWGLILSERFPVVRGRTSPVLYLRTRCDQESSELACNDDARSGSRTSELRRFMNRGNYYLIVDGYGSSSRGNYSLEVQAVSY